MGKDSSIEWTNHTFNPWWGCTKSSPGCDHCYAETLAKRTGFYVWGKDKPRRFFGDKHWDQPLVWNRQAEVAGKRRKVLCGSMCDVMEDRPELLEPRMRLFTLIEHLTEHLDWLTKHPENFARFLPALPLANLWLGVTAEGQTQADRRIPLLLQTPAARRFVSCEPLLGPLDLWQAASGMVESECKSGEGIYLHPVRALDWVICGGETGPRARPMHPDWPRSIRDHCLAAQVPFFFKGWGEWEPGEAGSVRVGKKTAGRLLDGIEWRQVSEVPKETCQIGS